MAAELPALAAAETALRAGPAGCRLSAAELRAVRDGVLAQDKATIRADRAQQLCRLAYETYKQCQGARAAVLAARSRARRRSCEHPCVALRFSA